MTLKAINGFQKTNEAKEIAWHIQFRASGAEQFRNDVAPKVSSPSAPVL